MDDTSADLTPAELAAQVGGLRSNGHLTDATTVPLLSPAECAEVLALADDDGWRVMEVSTSPPADRGHGAHRSQVVPTVRRGRRQAVPGGNRGELTTRISEQVFAANRGTYEFRLVGVEHPVELLWYSGESADGYVSHMDIGPAYSLRKLSFSLLLSDPAAFDGGELAFGTPGTPLPLARAQGTLTIFPSFLQHAVTPVTRGDRYTVVGFALGPAFS